MTDKTAKPKWLKELQSIILTRLPSPAEKEAWRQALYSAIPSGLPEEALTRIHNRFLHDLLVQKVQPLVPEGKKHTATRYAISGVVDLLNRSIKGETINDDQLQQAHTFAWSATDATRAGDAAAAAAWSVFGYADAATLHAARAGDAAAKFWGWAAGHLLELIKQESAPQAAQTA